MEEIYRVADRVAVLRDGRLIATEPAAVLSPERAIRLMVGRALGDMYPETKAVSGTTLLEVTDLSRSGAFANVTFAVRRGEIVGLAGLVGSGRTEIARILFGVDQKTGGVIRLDEQPVSFASPAQAMAAKCALRMGGSLSANGQMGEKGASPREIARA